MSGRRYKSRRPVHCHIARMRSNGHLCCWPTEAARLDSVRLESLNRVSLAHLLRREIVQKCEALVERTVFYN